MEANYHLMMIYFVKCTTVLELVFQPDVTVVRSSIPNDLFNTVLSARFDSNNVQERVKTVLSLFKNPPSWDVFDFDTPGELGETLLSAGFKLKEENIAMH